MHKLIADSGSTKTDWILVNGGDVFRFKTIGFNPFFVDSTRVVDEITTDVIVPLADKHADIVISEVHFYGAGCSSEDRCDIITRALNHCFPVAQITVDHDLLGAARALCGKEEGIAAILGTGSNSCHYDGRDIVQNVSALGYILGDEGSGAHIGKKFMKAYLNDEAPKELRDKFDETYNLSLDNILQAVYSKPLPNRFLAGFSKFVGRHINNPFCDELVRKCFHSFFKRHITKYGCHKEVPLNVVGSVAQSFGRQLTEVGQGYEVQIGKIIQSPLQGLVDYHNL